jgi:Uma2 family endonuclease
MEPVTTLPARRDGWTVDDLDDLPDDGLRYELVDGSLRVNPPPTNVHDYVVGRFVVLLDGTLDDSWRVIPGGGIRFDAHNYREPDLMVIKRDALHTRLADPRDVLLAIQVMSPSSVTTDRLVKPAQYAAAGIPHYWRLELGDVPVLVTHELEGEVYRETGRFADEVVVDRPVALRFRLADLLG